MLPFEQNLPMIGILCCVLSGLCCLILPRRHARYLSLATYAAHIVLSLLLVWHTLHEGVSFTYPMGHFPSPFGNELRAGPLEALIALFFSLVTFLSILGGTDDLERDIPATKHSYFYIMTNMLLAAQLVILYTNDIFTSFVFIESITLAACSLIAIKPGGRTLVATIWYLVMNLVGGSLFFFSISMLYGVTGHLLMPGLGEAVATLAATGQYTLPLFIVAGLLCTGLGIKCALFPFHSWLPGAYKQATTASSAVLSGLVSKCYIFLMFKVFVRVFGAPLMSILRITDILLVLGVLGLLCGSLLAIRQSDIKSMLAYSSVAQIGYIFIGIGLNTALGFAAACFQIVVHAVVKAMLFIAAGGLANASEHNFDWNSLRGAGHRNMAAGLLFTCGALSMIGIPLFPGFMAKLHLASASVGTPYAGIVLISVLALGTLLNAAYYVPALMCLYAKTEAKTVTPQLTQTLAHRIGLWSLGALSLGLGLFSSPIMETIELGVALFGM